MITEELKNQNFVVFKKQLEKFNIPIENLFATCSEAIKNAPLNNMSFSGLAYDGAMVNFVLKIMTPYAVKMNELLPETMRVDKTSLVKVCLLHQISKAITFQPNENKWEVENKGIVYKYASNPHALKSGIRSLIICQEAGISFTEEEIEAMIILDREVTDEQARYFSSTMAVIVKQANELSLLEIRNLKIV